MSDEASAFTTSSETMTAGGRHDNRQTQGNKRQRHSQGISSSESGSSDSPKDATEIKSSSRSQTPNESVAAAVDEVKASPEAGLGGPGPSNQKKIDNDSETKKPLSPVKESKFPPHAVAGCEPCHSKGREPCNCGKCKGRHVRRSDIVRKGLKSTRGDDMDKVNKESTVRRVMHSSPSSSYSLKSTPILKPNSLSTQLPERRSEGTKPGKRAKKAGKGPSAADDSKQSNSRDIDSKPKDSQRRENAKSEDTRSCDSRSTLSGRSSGRSSARSMESLDGHTELLESLVHAAHAEDKLHREKEMLQRELSMLEKQNDQLSQELRYALKVVDKLRDKCELKNKEKHDLKKQMRAEKAALERELQAILSNDQVTFANEGTRRGYIKHARE